jgi:hypothetical protein
MTNNLGLLTRLVKFLPYTEPYPNTTLQPDWDVTNVIIATLKDMKITPVFEHVKGHQDDHTPYDDLPLDAQLNVDADQEAGNYQQQFPAIRPQIPRLPHNRVQLHIHNKVISSKIKQSIRDAFTVPPYMEYLKRRNQWSSECLKTINWKAYNQAVSRFHSKRIQITKLCNDLLPTSSWVSRYDSLTSDHCLHCGESEDRDHLLRCTFAPREIWRKELLTHLREAHDNPLTNPYLLDILIDGLQLLVPTYPN